MDEKLKQFKLKFFGDRYEAIKEAIKQDIIIKQLVNDEYGQCKRSYEEYINLYLDIVLRNEIWKLKQNLMK